MQSDERVLARCPEALPRGRHQLTREQVRDAQRERLLAAVTELLAARGYRGFGVGDIASRVRGVAGGVLRVLRRQGRLRVRRL